ncbi:hypothetical protein [Clostridium fallax]|uniref:O-Antigen ligase n=1 Tax=Clostridium fallax TaxID=1533 RepID=A0A1M4SYV1_9CLOT|nr:hypothetical protein [Clostridium fallax]SHE37418.1 hypothetical protein SAMN05443638_101246 [Clostridium fallax]SQB08041.1 Lipid A core - O-antigen ligase and related enzymes [Clostridium fallax]
MKFNKWDLLIMIPFLFPLTLMENYKFFYIPFFIILLKNIYLCYKKSISIEELLIVMAIYSILISDNFIIIGFVGLLGIYYFIQIILKKRKLDFKDKTFTRMIIILGIYLVFNIIVNRVPLPNVILFFMYNIVFMAIPVMFKFLDVDCYKTIDKTINTALISQMIAVVLVVILNFGVVLSNLFGDWSIGTLGVSQGVQLFNLFIFGSIKFFAYFNKTKEKKYLGGFIICVLFSLSTVTLANTMLFFLALGIYVILFISSPKFKILFLGIIVALVGTFWFTSHPWVREQMKDTLFNSEFRNERIKKLKTYEDTYIKLPQKDLKAAAIGVGAGYYSSRSALTVSGYYTTWYNKDRFPTYVNKYARKYIRPRIYQRMGLSIVDQPTSQYISIMGEFGYIGVILFAVALILLLFKSNRYNGLTLIYFAITLSLDNYMEYPKIALMFWITYFLIEQTGCFNE